MHKAVPAVVLAMCACSGKSIEPHVAAAPTAKVTSAVITDPMQPPPALVIVSAAGKTSTNSAPSWDAIAKLDLDKGSHPAERTSFTHEPPPLESEDDPVDDSAEDSGGTSAHLDFDESARKPGEYERKRTADARAANYRLGGSRGPLTKYTGHAGVVRASTIVGEVVRDGVELDAQQLGLVVADPHAKATAMIDAVLASQGLIAVATAKGVRPLRIQFLRDREGHGDPRHWIELHVGATALAFEAVPAVPVVAPSFEQAAFASALARARDTRKLDPRAPVDVLVDPEVDAQRLVDAIIALDQAGVTMIGLGAAPIGDAAKQRGAPHSDVAAKRITAQGDLDKAVIRRGVGESLSAIHACYDMGLAKRPDLAGRVTVMFFIQPDGKVGSSSAAGVDPDVATCIAGVIKAITFPKPRGGGGVQVNYPFALEPA